MQKAQLAYSAACMAVWLEKAKQEQVAAEQYVATLAPGASEGGEVWLTKVQSRRRVLEALASLLQELSPVPLVAG